MIVYNITTQVASSINSDWKKWLLEIHVPYLLSTKFFTGYQLVKLLEVDMEEGITYALQLYCEDIQTLDNFRKNLMPAIRKEEKMLWADGVFSFDSVMQVIN